MTPLISLALTALFVIAEPLAYAEAPYEPNEPGTGSASGTTGSSETPFDPDDLIPAHPDARNTVTCNYHGTTSPHDATYAAFASSLVGPKGNKGLIQKQVEYHNVGGASVVIIENGAITQHHWYGCQDRPAAKRRRQLAAIDHHRPSAHYDHDRAHRQL